jgi:beta-glucosidase
MSVRRGRIAMAMAAVAASAAVAGGVYAAGGPKDEAALEPARPAASKDIEKRVNALLRKMTTEEKLQQVQLLSTGR